MGYCKLPKIWKLSTVIPILKPNKDASECKNYRPISLTSTLCKLMEWVIHRRLMNWLIENKKLHFYQTAFREPIIVLPPPRPALLPETVDNWFSRKASQENFSSIFGHLSSI
ncbi:hypothetical protein TNCV_4163321 [Trichonephila clavipes]|nr:hypothetical protein TNCV_4163321 [Trichonephila clavipes]